MVGVNQQGQGLLQLIDRKEKQEEVVSVKTADKSEEDWPGNLPRQVSEVDIMMNVCEVMNIVA